MCSCQNSTSHFLTHFISVLLQNGADPNIRNTDGKTPLDLADPPARAVLTGDYRKDDLLEAARSGNEEKMMSLLTPLNVNCHASDGRKVSNPQHYPLVFIPFLFREKIECNTKGI